VVAHFHLIAVWRVGQNGLQRITHLPVLSLLSYCSTQQELAQVQTICYTREVMGDLRHTRTEVIILVSNETIIARNCHCDAVRLSFPRRGSDETQRLCNHIYAALSEASGMSDYDVRQYVKYHIVKSGRRGGAELDTFFIGGKLSKFFSKAGLGVYVENISEIHAKFYLVEKYDAAHEDFVTALWTGTGSFVVNGYNPGKQSRSPRSSGNRGATVGNPKSDLHCTVNRYRGERSASEGHLRGLLLASDRRDILEWEYVFGSNRSTQDYVDAIFAQAARRTARRLLAACRSRGINIVDYFKGVSGISWEKPLHHEDWDVLNSDEEKQYIKFADVPGYRYVKQSELDLDP